MNTTTRNWAIGVAIIVLAIVIVSQRGQQRVVSPNTPAPTSNGGKMLNVVAAENFWGSLVSQLGGTHVRVVSIVSDPNADPHEYESNTDNARAIAAADYVIENGAGYDSWADKLLNAGTNPQRTVLKVATFLGKKEGDNPHFWYSPEYVNRIVAQMEKDLETIDPADSSYYQGQYKVLQKSLAQYQGRIETIKKNFNGAKVAATEDIFVYPAQAMGLDLISPPPFIQAVGEGNDPPAASVVEYGSQLKSGLVKAMVYNEQTVTPLTESIKKLAAEQGIPIVGITETIQPPDASFQDWMNGELLALQNALNAKALGK